MSGPRIGELFAGIGGLGLGVRDAIGGHVAWVSEIDPTASAVLDARIGAPNLGDITAVDWAVAPPVDVLLGGFPCQDVSTAGLRRGIAPGTRSGLWAHFATAIDRLRPGLVVIENVRGLLSATAESDRDLEHCPGCLGDPRGGPRLRALGAVFGDLADLGFDAEWTCLAASAVGAPHRRDRVFVVAWPAGADPARVGLPRAGIPRPGRPGPADSSGHAPDPDGVRRERIRDELPNSHDTDGRDRPHEVGYSAGPETGRRRPAPDAGRRPRPQDDADGTPARRGSGAAAWGRYGAAVAKWERVLGRPAPDPTVVSDRSGTPVLSARAVEWLMGFPDGWVADLPGVSRTAALRCLGNAVVPQQAATATRLLLDRAAEGSVDDLAVA